MTKRTVVVLSIACLLWNAFHAAAQLPSSYDARDFGLITSVKNQSRLGTCWAFAATSQLETGYIKAGLGSAANTDFSEWQMANYAHPQSYNVYTEPYYTAENGWGSRATDPIYYTQAQLSSVFVNESAAPYPLSQIEAEETLTPPPRQNPSVGRALVSSYNYRIMGGDYLASTEVQQIKGGILNSGSIVAGITWARDAVSTNNGNVVYNNTTEASDGGHAITVVGWDDSVWVNETQQGAFITKNSWAENWGNDGYFYLSYDSYIGRGSAATWLEVKDASHLTSAYSTMPELDGADEKYWSSRHSTPASAIAAKMDLDLTLSEDDLLVSLGLNASGGELQIQLFANEADALGSGTGDSLLYEGSHLFNDAGFQMIDLGEGVDVSAAEELWVVYDNADGNAIMYEFTEGALTNDYCYFLNGDTWEGSSASNALAPVSFYMVPEPSTFALILYMGGGLFLLRRLRA